MLAARSLAFNVLFFAWGALVHLLAVPTLLLPPRTVNLAARLWARGTFLLLAAICGLRYRIRGTEHLPRVPCIVAAKHQSVWDTLALSALIDNPSFVLKRELLAIPLFGWYVRHAGCVPIDRRGGARALKGMIAAARAAVARGQCVVIFPEGTRVAPGTHRPYHPGVAALYAQLEVPVVPVALDSGRFWGRRSFLKKPGRITLEFLEPIAPGLPRDEFTAELARRIDTASDRLLAEAERAQAGTPEAGRDA